MDQNTYSNVAGYGPVASVDERNRVLRNTYWLLALSMVPTVLGAWIGVSTGFMATMGVGMSAILFLAGAYGLMFAVHKYKNSAVGVPLLLGFTFFMGLMLSQLLAFMLKSYTNGGELIFIAFGGTSAVFFGMATLSTVIKRDLSAMGKFLFIGMIMVFVAAIANLFLQSSALMVTISVLVVGIFSAFILYDLQRVKNGLETNYIVATLSVYISLYNVFTSLLQLLGLFGGSRD